LADGSRCLGEVSGTLESQDAGQRKQRHFAQQQIIGWGALTSSVDDHSAAVRKDQSINARSW